MGELHVDIPDSIRCPITCALFRDPVMTAAGRTYERHAIAQFWRGRARQSVDPMTNRRLEDSRLITNYDKRDEVQLFLDQHPRFCPDEWPDRDLPPPAEMPEFVSDNDGNMQMALLDPLLIENRLEAAGSRSFEVGDFVSVVCADLGVPTSCIGRIGRVAATDVYHDNPRATVHFSEYSGGRTPLRTAYYFVYTHLLKCETFEAGDRVNIASVCAGVPAAYIGQIGTVASTDVYNDAPRVTVEFSDGTVYFFLCNRLKRATLRR
jgi:hypothetical protein